MKYGKRIIGFGVVTCLLVDPVFALIVTIPLAFIAVAMSSNSKETKVTYQSSPNTVQSKDEYQPFNLDRIKKVPKSNDNEYKPFVLDNVNKASNNKTTIISSAALATTAAATASATHSWMEDDEPFMDDALYGNVATSMGLGVNPASGLPMDSLGSFDIAGNAFGTDTFSSPSDNVFSSGLDDSFSSMGDSFSSMDDSFSLMDDSFSSMGDSFSLMDDTFSSITDDF